MRMALLLVSCAVSTIASAQTTNPYILLEAAERTAAEAEQAAASARQAVLTSDAAAKSAEAAATSARQAALAARNSTGMLVPEEPLSAPSARVDRKARDSEQNLPVKRPDTSEIVPKRAAVAAALASSVANGPNESFLKSTTTPDFQVIASDKDKVASIAWTLDLSRPTPGRLSTDQLTLTASGKFDGESDTGLLGLSGFPNGTEVKIKYIHFGGDMNLTGEERAPVAEARKRCERITGDPIECNPYAGTGPGPFVKKYNPEGYGAMLDEVLPGSIWFAGLEFAGNQTSYNFLDRTAFAIDKRDRLGFSGAVFGGLLLNRGLTALTASYSWRRQYSPSGPVTLCQPVPQTVQTQCITAPDGAPSRDTASIVGIELRNAFPGALGEFAQLAVAPEVNYDLTSTAWSLELPIYFAGDGSGKLRGGVQGAYVNERDGTGGRKDGFQLGLFVGVPFSFFSN